MTRATAPRRNVFVLALLVCLAGALALLGWALGRPLVAGLLPDAARMRLDTAAALVLAGVSLWFGARAGPVATRAARACAAVVVLLAGLRLVQAAAEGDASPLGSALPDHMAPVTALALLLAGAALLSITWRPGAAPAQLMALASACLTLTVLVRYAYALPLLGGVPFTPDLGPHTSLALLALAAGLLLVRGDEGPVAVVGGPTVGGAMARQLLPWIVGVPIALGWLRLLGQYSGLYGTELGLSLYVVASAAVLLGLVWWSARRLDQAEAQRTLAATELREEQERFRVTFEQAAVGIAHVALDGRWLRMNARLCEIVGYDREELLKRTFQDITHPDDLDTDLALVRRMLNGEIPSYSLHKRYIRRDGGVVWANLTVSLVRDASGAPRYFIAVVEDIGSWKAAQTALSGSEERYRRIFEAVPVSLWEEDWAEVVDAVDALRARGVGDLAAYQREHPEFTTEMLQKVRILDVNQRTLDMFGARDKEQMLESLETVFSTEDTLPGFAGEIAALGRGQREYETEMALRTVSGELIYVLLTMRFPGPGTGSGDVLVSLMEITGRKRTEQALAESEERFRRAVTEAPIPMLIHDEDDRILHMSRGWTEHSGYTPADLPTLGDWTERAYGERTGSVKEYIDRLFDIEKTVANGEWTIRTRDGPERVWDFFTTPLGRGADGRRLLLSIAVDVTERKAAEAGLARYAAELERSNQDLQEFAFVASHDLQEPLRKIVAFGDRLRARSAGALDDQSRDYLARMERAAGRMGELIESLLELSRVTTRGAPARPVDLDDVLAEVLGDMDERIRETGANIEAEPLPTVQADPQQMRQLFQNLLANALKFRAGAVRPRIRIAAERAGGVWQISVSDDGIGFDEKYLDRIFKPFQRLHGRSEYEGSGMGLSICRKIVARHGGEITARSRPGEGATFVVRLPGAPELPLAEGA